MGRWADDQRQLKRKGLLHERRDKKLSKVGFSWDIIDERWNVKYQEVIKFIEEYGHFPSMATTTDENRQLYDWVRYQKARPNVNLGSPPLTQIQEDKLDEINWRNPYTRTDKQWDDKFKMVQRYKIENGHVRVNKNLNDYHGVRLGNWVKAVKSTNGIEKLTESQLNRMVAIGVLNQDRTRVQHPRYE